MTITDFNSLRETKKSELAGLPDDRYEVFWNSSGDKAIAVSYSNFGEIKIYVAEYSVDTSYAYSELTDSNQVNFQAISDTEGNRFDVSMSPSGDRILFVENLFVVTVIDLAGSFDASTVNSSTYNVDNLYGISVTAGQFNSDGSKVFLSTESEDIKEYNLSTNYDISTATDSGENLDTGLFSSMFRFYDNGSKILVAEGTGSGSIQDDDGTLKVYSLATAYDLSSSTEEQTVIPFPISYDDRAIGYNLYDSDNRLAVNFSSGVVEYQQINSDIETTIDSFSTTDDNIEVTYSSNASNSYEKYLAYDESDNIVQEAQTSKTTASGTITQELDSTAGDPYEKPLPDDTSYYVQAVTDMGDYKSTSQSKFVSTNKEPQVSHISVVDKGVDFVEFEMEVLGLGTSEPRYIGYVYTVDQTTSDLKEVTSLGTYNITVNGLEGDTEYSFSPQMQNSDGNTVASDDEVIVTTDKPATYKVTIDNHPTEVSNNDIINVDYTINNIGDFDGSKTIEFYVENNLEDSTTANITAGGSYSDSFSYDASQVSYGDLSLEVSTVDDSEVVTTTVQDSDYIVNITGGDSFVFEDDILDVDYEVVNNGNIADTKDVELTTTVQGSDTVVDSDTVSLDPGQTKTGTLSYDLTGEPADPEETATVSTEDSSSSGLFYVAQHKFLETVDQLEDGQEYEFRAAAEDDFGIDTGSIKTTTTVERQNGTVSTVESVSSDISQRQLDLEGTIDAVGDYAEVGFDAFFKYREQGASTWNETSRTGFTSTGVLQETVTGLTEETTYEYKFVADFGGQEVDGETYTATTLAPVFDFTIDNINDFLKEGRTLSIDYTVENTGTVESTQDLNLAFDTDTNVVDSAESVTVESGSTSSGTFTFDTTGQTEGVYDIYMFGAEGVTQSSVEILVNSLIEFLTPAANEIVANRSPELEYRLDIEGSGTVEVKFDGETVDTLNAPFDNATQVSSLSDLDRDNQSKNLNIVYTGGQTDRDVTRSFVTGFVLKETDPEVI